MDKTVAFVRKAIRRNELVEELRQVEQDLYNLGSPGGGLIINAEGVSYTVEYIPASIFNPYILGGCPSIPTLVPRETVSVKL